MIRHDKELALLHAQLSTTKTHTISLTESLVHQKRMLRMPVVENVDMHTYTKFDQTVQCFSFVMSISLTFNRRTDKQTDILTQ